MQSVGRFQRRRARRPRQQHQQRAIVRPPEELERRTLLAAAAALVADVNDSEAGSAPSALTPVGDTLYFTARDPATGRELWKTDGTAGGTALVKDLVPGAAGSNPRLLTPAGDALYFVADDATGRPGLFRTDGTAGGTVRVTTPEPNVPPSSLDLQLANVNGRLFFATGFASGNQTTGAFPAALWTTDGTEAGTVRMKEFGPTNRLRELEGVGDTLYFVGFGGDDGLELWRSDGTTDGTVRVKDIYPGATGSVPHELTAVGGTLFFTATSNTAGTVLFESDGTDAGTVPVTDAGGATMVAPSRLAAANGLLYFTKGASALVGAWRTDGTPAGTFRLQPGGFDPETGEQFTATAGGKVFFTSRTSSLGPPVTRDMWVTDGTSRGTTLILSFAPFATTNMDQLTAVGDRLFFTANNNDGLGNELWTSNGTPGAGTHRVLDLNPGAGFGVNPNFAGTTPRLAALGGALLFAGNDGQTGTELYRSDGTAGGTNLLADLPSGTNGSNPGPAVRAGSLTYFAASRPDVGNELFRSDGTPGGTSLVKDINPGTGDGAPQSLVDLGDLLVFTAQDEVNNRELWRSDGTPDGTFKLKDIYPALSSVDFPTELTVFNGFVYFRADDLTHGEELWRTDGTPEGTVRVTDGNPDGGNFWPSELRVWNGALYFRAETGEFGSELYRSDGTADGTVRLTDLVAGAGGASPSNLTPVGDRLFFTAFGSAAGLWKTDGTAGGAVLVKAVNGADRLRAAGGRLFFRASGASADELWVSDGTEAGTVLVYSFPGLRQVGFELAAVNGLLVFDASDAAGGRELWRSDGTPDGTYRLADIFPGPGSAQPTGLRVVPAPGGAGERCYFAANDGARGSELWVTDGTPAGTRLALELYPGPTGSSPQNLTDVGGTLWFTADHPQFGREMWKLAAPPVSQVLLAGSSWTPAFAESVRAHGLGDGGGVALTDGAAPVATLPWVNLNQVKVRFDRDGAVSQDALRLSGTRTDGYPVASFAYDPATRTATWTFARPFGPDRLALDVGDGHTWSADVLPGDAYDGGGAVNAFDYLAVRIRQGAKATMANAATYPVYLDVDGTGRVDVLDLAAVKVRLGKRLNAVAGLSAPAVMSLAPASDGPGLVERLKDQQVLA